MTFATLIVAGLLTVLAGCLTAYYLKEDGIFGALWTFFFAGNAANAAYQLSMADTTVKSLDNTASALMSGFFLMLFLRFLFGSVEFTPKDALENLTMLIMVGAISTKAKELVQTGPQPMLHNVNALLVTLSFVLLVGLTIVYIQAYRAKQSAEAESRRVTANVAQAPVITQPVSGPFVITDAQPPASGANLKKNL